MKKKKKSKMAIDNKKIAARIKRALREVELHEKGMIKLKTFDEFLNEL